MFDSRKKIKKEDFVNDFLETLIPGLIKRNEFIDWNRIFDSNECYKNFIEDLEEYKNLNEEDLKQKILDTILSLDNSIEFINYCFVLLGNTNEYYVSDQDSIIYKNLGNNIDENNSKKIADAIVDIGFKNVLDRTNINDYFIGLLVGFESDKRKNKGGKKFVNYITPELENIVSKFSNFTLKEEYNIKYGNGSNQNKKVDFAIFDGEKCIVGIEVNFYTNSGSKPTEIKRSYGEVNRKLNKLGIELVWITDGFGYNKMKKSLGDAFEIHSNIYNVSMLKKSLENDLKEFIKK